MLLERIATGSPVAGHAEAEHWKAGERRRRDTQRGEAGSRAEPVSGHAGSLEPPIDPGRRLAVGDRLRVDCAPEHRCGQQTQDPDRQHVNTVRQHFEKDEHTRSVSTGGQRDSREVSAGPFMDIVPLT